MAFILIRCYNYVMVKNLGLLCICFAEFKVGFSLADNKLAEEIKAVLSQLYVIINKGKEYFQYGVGNQTEGT